MVGQPGRSGTNKGKDKPWTDALRLAVHEAMEDGGTKLRAMARKLVEKAINGDTVAAKEIGDRLEGKAVQGVEMSGPDGGPIETAEYNQREVSRRVTYMLTDGGLRKAKIEAAIAAGEAVDPLDVQAVLAAQKLADTLIQSKAPAH